MNCTHSHDWGDDFALYLMQADQLADFNSPLVTKYLYNPEYPLMSPPAYPPGFPFLLSFVALFSPHGLDAYMMYMNVFAIGFGMVVFYFFRRYFSFVTALICTLLIVYNAWFVAFKSEVLSDMPFALFFMLGFYLLKKRKHFLLAGGVIGFCITIRSIGLAIPVGMMLYMLVMMLRNYVHEKDFNVKSSMNIYFGKIILVLILFYLLNILFTRQGYTSIFLSADVWNTIKINLEYYFILIRSYLDLENPYVPYLALLFKIFFTLCFIFGLVSSLITKRRVMDYIFLVYLAVLIVYPYHLTGFRFILPVFPFVMFYAIDTVFRLNQVLRVNVIYYQIGIVIPFALVYMIQIQKVNLEAKKMKPGPCEIESVQAFHYISENTSANSTVLFSKPKALAYFTHRFSLSNNPKGEVSEVEHLIKKYKVNYILLHTDNRNIPLEKFVEKENLHPRWKNTKFTLYQLPVSL